MATKAGTWTVRAAMVARWFGVEREAVDLAGRMTIAAVGPRVRLGGGRVVLVTGASGAGKSTFLRRLRRRWAGRVGWVDLPSLGEEDDGWLVIDVMTEAMGGGRDEASVVAALEALSRVGLGEVWTYLRTPGALSEGQRWRLRLAVGLARAGEGRRGHTQPLNSDFTTSGRPSPCPLPAYRERVLKRPLNGGARGEFSVLAIDEFAAPLDRVTAMVVARALRKAVSARADLCAVVATSHDDLVGALGPDVVVRCDFGAFEVLKGGTSHGAE